VVIHSTNNWMVVFRELLMPICVKQARNTESPQLLWRGVAWLSAYAEMTATVAS